MIGRGTLGLTLKDSVSLAETPWCCMDLWKKMEDLVIREGEKYKEAWEHCTTGEFLMPWIFWLDLRTSLDLLHSKMHLD